MTDAAQMYFVEVNGIIISFNIISASAGSGQEAYHDVSLVRAMIVDTEEFSNIYGDDAMTEFAADPLEWAWERFVMCDAGVWLMEQVGQ